ncbi:unknown [[Mannheimia] succiniciproducens MBEL55E]|uniref:Uncharacterized protein n=1 Tax=Mannheimia succiniciproducens (strain KCTC 0769BP / MBEL55E) TaxID=221988 RepID=Q65T77_MANSM|nr:unknown [[Mannheimia] succiniciproducens MBEL55E]
MNLSGCNKHQHYLNFIGTGLYLSLIFYISMLHGTRLFAVFLNIPQCLQYILFILLEKI